MTFKYLKETFYININIYLRPVQSQTLKQPVGHTLSLMALMLLPPVSQQHSGFL